MFLSLLKKRRLGFFLLACLVVAGLYFYFDVKDPQCVNAQNCYSILPEVRYASTGYRGCYPSSGCNGCATGTMVLSSFTTPLTPGKFNAALTGFDFEFRYQDNNMRRERVYIGNPYAGGGNTLNIPYTACFYDRSINSGEDDFIYNIGIVAYAWQ